MPPVFNLHNIGLGANMTGIFTLFMVYYPCMRIET